jgi:hypothetical protein
LADYTLKKNDTFPVLTAILSDQVGPVNLTSADSVKLIMKSGGTTIQGTCAITLPQTGGDVGKVTYDWAPADTATTGTYQLEFEVTWNAGDIETFPNDGYKELEIVADLA